MTEMVTRDIDQIAEWGDYIMLKKEKYSSYPTWMWDACFEVLESDDNGVYVDGYDAQIPHEDYELMIVQ
jgi:hypothetical protein